MGCYRYTEALISSSETESLNKQSKIQLEPRLMQTMTNITREIIRIIFVMIVVNFREKLLFSPFIEGSLLSF